MQEFLQGQGQPCMGMRCLAQAFQPRLQCGFSGLQVARLGDYQSEAVECTGSHCVSGGRGLVGKGLGAVDEGFVVVGGKEKTAPA